MSSTRENRILVIDDNSSIHDDFRKILCDSHLSDDDELVSLFLDEGTVESDSQSVRFRVDCASQGQEGLELVQAAIASDDPYAVAFVDMRMPPGWDGLHTIGELWKADPDIQVVICSAYTDYRWSDIKARIGKTDRLLVLKKPFDAAEAIQIAVALSEKWRLTKETRQIVRERTERLTIAEASLMGRSLHLEMAANLADIAYWSFDIQTQKLTISPNAAELYDLDVRHVDGLAGLVQVFNRHDQKTLMERLDNAVLFGKDFACKSWLTTPGGQKCVVQFRVKCKRDSHGELESIFGVMQDVTRSEEALLAVEYAAFHDPLTDLPNRAKFLDSLDNAIKQTKRHGNHAVFILLDVDNFKNVNDSHGHPVGDGILQGFARRLRATIREIDTVARLGGDEFALVQTNVESARDTIALLERIHELTMEPFHVDGKAVFASFSAGVAMAPANGNDVETLMKAGDLALYRAKQDGRGGWRFFDAKMDRKMQARRKTELDLDLAIERQEFELFYQPIVETKTQRVSGMEALIRWTHPTRGRIPPDEFIEIAEESGAIVRIGNWVLAKACEDAKAWPQDTKVAVNVSPVQFKNSRILESVADALASSQLPPQRLEIEITESVFLDRTAETLEILHALRDMGIRIAMDDFGIGYSSLSYLRSFPFDKLKLDKSFVLDSDEKQESRVIISAVAGLGRSLNMATCSEGVETEAQFRQIRDEGYTHAQGYLFGKPRPLNEIPPTLFSETFAVSERVPAGHR